MITSTSYAILYVKWYGLQLLSIQTQILIHLKQILNNNSQTVKSFVTQFMFLGVFKEDI